MLFVVDMYHSLWLPSLLMTYFSMLVEVMLLCMLTYRIYLMWLELVHVRK